MCPTPTTAGNYPQEPDVGRHGFNRNGQRQRIFEWNVQPHQQSVFTAIGGSRKRQESEPGRVAAPMGNFNGGKGEAGKFTLNHHAETVRRMFLSISVAPPCGHSKELLRDNAPI